VSRSRLLPYLAFVGLSLIWGGSFLAIKLTVQDMSPTALLLFRSVFGVLGLVAILLFLRKPFFGAGWRGRLWGFAIMAITNAVIPWVAIGWGEERISSGLASILNSTTTLWTAVLIYWVMPSERPSLVNYIGVLVGFGGVLVLVYPELSAHGVSGDVLGALAVIVASLSYAVNALYQRRKMRDVSIFEISLGQLAASVLFATACISGVAPGDAAIAVSRVCTVWRFRTGNSNRTCMAQARRISGSNSALP